MAKYRHQFREGDKVKLKTMENLPKVAEFLDADVVTEVVGMTQVEGFPIVILKATKNADHPAMQVIGGAPVGMNEFDDIEFISTSLQNQFLDEQVAAEHGLEPGDRVVVKDADAVWLLNETHRNGDVLVVSHLISGLPVLEVNVDGEGLIVAREELRGIEKLKEAN